MAATISVGYGDGLDPELVRVGGPVLIGGQRARLLALLHGPDGGGRHRDPLCGG